MPFDHERAYENLNHEATRTLEVSPPPQLELINPGRFSQHQPQSISYTSHNRYLVFGSSSSSSSPASQAYAQLSIHQQSQPVSATPQWQPPNSSTTASSFGGVPIRPASPSNHRDYEDNIRTAAKGVKRVLKKSYHAWVRATGGPPSVASSTPSNSNSSSSHQSQSQYNQQEHQMGHAHSHGHSHSGHGNNHPTQSELNADALAAEIQRTTQVDMSNIVAQFKDLNRDIERLCDKLGRFASKAKLLPPPENGPFGDDLDWRAHFTNAEDFVFYGALVILNSYICNLLLVPFHPIMNSEENREAMDTWNNRTQTELQRDLADWRSAKFMAFESTLDELRKGTLLQTILNDISSRIADRLLVLPDNPDFNPMTTNTSTSSSTDAIPSSPTILPSIVPAEWSMELSQILAQVYAWNVIVKRDVLDYDLLPYAPEPGAPWDSSSMDSFENLKPSEMRALLERERAGEEVRTVGPMSIGLRARASLGPDKEALSLPQVRVKVLLEQNLPNVGLQPPAPAQNSLPNGNGGGGGGLHRSTATHRPASPNSMAAAIDNPNASTENTSTSSTHQSRNPNATSQNRNSVAGLASITPPQHPNGLAPSRSKTLPPSATNPRVTGTETSGGTHAQTMDDLIKEPPPQTSEPWQALQLKASKNSNGLTPVPISSGNGDVQTPFAQVRGPGSTSSNPNSRTNTPATGTSFLPKLDEPDGNNSATNLNANVGMNGNGTGVANRGVGSNGVGSHTNLPVKDGPLPAPPPPPPAKSPKRYVGNDQANA